MTDDLRVLIETEQGLTLDGKLTSLTTIGRPAIYIKFVPYDASMNESFRKSAKADAEKNRPEGADAVVFGKLYNYQTQAAIAYQYYRLAAPQ